MPQITFGGSAITATGLPDVYAQIQAPPSGPLSGGPSNIIGVVGTATWGPVNSPTVFGDYASGALAFGDMQNRKYDLMTPAAAAIAQGANSFVGVRVTDGTDVAATATVLTNCLTLTAKYTGTKGNSLGYAIAAGSAASSFKITLTLPGRAPETFDNITGTGNAFWVNAAAAINNGQSQTRGPSQLVVATAGVGTTAASAQSGTLSGGSDGATTITGTVLIGSDSTPRTGMYALRNMGAALMVLADCDDSTTWTTQLAFAKSELLEAVATSPSGDTLTNFGTAMTSAGIDDPWIKVMFGDWLYMSDGVNKITRLVSPQGFYAGVKAVLGPHQSALNKPVLGVAGSQSSYNNKTYSVAELNQLVAARGDIIMAPSVGGAYWSCRTGRNTSSDPARHQDAYTTYTNYLARAMAYGGAGKFVGRLITPSEMREAQSAIGAFGQAEIDAGRMQAFSAQVDARNNPQSQTAVGIQKATVLAQYFGVLEEFLIDFTGGSTVAIPTSTLAAAA